MRRLFSAEIVESDAFLDMPISTQALYFHLGMNADDDGFVNPKKIMRLIGASDDDLKVLLSKRFLLPFPSGVIVIKHWLIHNSIRKDRYNETKYLDEKGKIFIKENKAYTDMATNGQPIGNQWYDNPAHQVKLSKVKLSKVKEDAIPFERFWNTYPKKVEKKKSEEKWLSLSSEVQKLILEDIPRRIKEHGQWIEGYVPNPTTYLNGERWNDAIIPLEQNKEKVLITRF